MDPARYQQVAAIYHEALGVSLSERAALLERRCGEDHALRLEVEELLAAHEQAERFIETPAIDVAAQTIAADQVELGPGSRIGRYNVVSLLGRGGMGAVYLARDHTLHRQVAIKVLRHTLSPTAGAVRRFAQEARAASALNHPNIVTIHEIGEDAGSPFIAMEFVEGRPLTELLGQPVALDRLLALGRQLAQALAVAHAAGIVHRDIKPDNVMVREDGYVKVLDFGIARLVSADGRAPTRATQTGVLVGTPLYMAPEQLRGEPATSAADVYALGVVLYELATGQHPLQHGVAAHDGRAISDFPPGIESLIARMRSAAPGGRPSARDVEAALTRLEHAAADKTAATGADVRHPWTILRSRPWLVAAGLLAIIVIVAMTLWRRAPTAPPIEPAAQLQFTQSTFDGAVQATALSPDGRSIAYALGDFNVGSIVVRDLRGGRSLEVWKGAGVVTLRWAPDGSVLLAQTHQGAYLIPRLGGAPRRLNSVGPAVAFAPDGSQLASAFESELGFGVSSLDGTSRRSVKLQGFRWIIGLDWSAATGRLWLHTLDHEDKNVFWSVKSDGSDVRREYSDPHVVRGMCTSPVTGDVYVLRLRNGVDELLGFAGGSTNPIVLSRISPAAADTRSGCSVSSDGRRLVYVAESGQANLWRLDVDGPGPPVPITRGTRRYTMPSVSPDGDSIIASVGPETAMQLVRVPLPDGDEVPLTAGANGVVSSQTGRLAYVLHSPGDPFRIWTSGAEGSQPTPVSDAATNNMVGPLWLPDGRLAWQTPDAHDYRVRNLQTGGEERLVGNDSESWVFFPTFSPRANHVAVHWNRAPMGPTEVAGLWLLTWPQRQARFLAPYLIPIAWSPDEKWIYAYGMPPTQAIMRVEVATGKTEPAASLTRGVLTMFEPCALTPNGAALICSLMESNTDAWIIEGLSAR